MKKIATHWVLISLLFSNILHTRRDSPSLEEYRLSTPLVHKYAISDATKQRIVPIIERFGFREQNGFFEKTNPKKKDQVIRLLVISITSYDNFSIIKTTPPDHPFPLFIIVINEKDIQKYTDEELQFLIGHEIGHIWQSLNHSWNTSNMIPDATARNIECKELEKEADLFSARALKSAKGGISVFRKWKHNQNYSKLWYTLVSYFYITVMLWDTRIEEPKNWLAALTLSTLAVFGFGYLFTPSRHPSHADRIAYLEEYEASLNTNDNVSTVREA